MNNLNKSIVLVFSVISLFSVEVFAKKDTGYAGGPHEQPGGKSSQSDSGSDSDGGGKGAKGDRTGLVIEERMVPIPVPIPGMDDMDQDSIMNILCPNCYMNGFSIMPTVSLDYDRNRYIVYLGSDEVVDGNFSTQSGTFTGPFEVIDYGRFFGGLGAVGGYTIFQLGLGVHGSTGYHSARYATNFEEAKSMKRLTKIPKKVEDFYQLPNKTQIRTILHGGIVFSANIAVFYAPHIGGDIEAMGTWEVGIFKKSDYLIQVSLLKSKAGAIRGVGGVPLTRAQIAAVKGTNLSFSFEIDLNTEQGIDALGDFFAGKINNLQRLVKSADNQSVINLRGKDISGDIFKGVTEYEGVEKKTQKTASIGVPFLASAARDFGSTSFFTEKIRYLSDQDVTSLGPLPKDTEVHTLRGLYARGKFTLGLLSNHMARNKQFQARMDTLSFPEVEIQTPKKNTTPSFNRMYVNYVYQFQKNRWSKKDWTKEIKFLSRRIGHREKLLANIPPFPVDGNVTIPYSSFRSSFKISFKAIVALVKLAKEANKEGSGWYLKTLITKANNDIQEWFSNVNHQEGELCDLPINCKGRTISNTKSGIKKAVNSLFKIGSILDDLLDANSVDVRRKFIREVVEFGKGFTVNQFTVHAFERDLIYNRKIDQENDFAFCVRWRGTAYRRGEYVIYPSQRSERKAKCFLKEEFVIDKIAEKHDKELFGPSIVLENE